MTTWEWARAENPNPPYVFGMINPKSPFPYELPISGAGRTG
jgi:hypothetical protein